MFRTRIKTIGSSWLTDQSTTCTVLSVAMPSKLEGVGVAV